MVTLIRDRLRGTRSSLRERLASYESFDLLQELAHLINFNLSSSCTLGERRGERSGSPKAMFTSASNILSYRTDESRRFPVRPREST